MRPHPDSPPGGRIQSTDPAHNLSDAFGQKFSKDATKVNGFDNLYAMEIDPTSAIQEMVEQCISLPALFASRRRAYAFVPMSADQNGMMGSMMQDLAFAIPGVDEAMSFAEIMKYAHLSLFAVCIPDAVPSQARQIHGILCHRLRHRTDWSHASIPLLPHRP